MTFHLRHMVLALTAATALAGPAYAQSPTFAGFVSPAGEVTGANAFQGARTGVGLYKITAAQSLFPSGFPVMTVTPFGIDGAYTSGVLDAAVCGSGICTWTVQLLSLKSGKPHDNGWVFTIIDTPN